MALASLTPTLLPSDPELVRAFTATSSGTDAYFGYIFDGPAMTLDTVSVNSAERKTLSDSSHGFFLFR